MKKARKLKIKRRRHNFYRRAVRRTDAKRHNLDESNALTSEARNQQIRDVAENTLRRTTFALLALCVYSASVLLKPDFMLLDRNSTLELPLNSGQISYNAFLIIGPMMITSFWIFQSLYRTYLENLGESRLSLPFVFNLPEPAPRFISSLLLHWVVPLTMLVFVWRSSPRPIAPLLKFICAATVSMALHQLLRRKRAAARRFLTRVAFVLVVTILFLWGQRTLDLRGANLRGFDLRGQNLSRAKFDKYTDFTNADLEHTNLSSTDLSIVKGISTANLRGANLSNAVLVRVTPDVKPRLSELQGADLTGANLARAVLIRAVLIETNLRRANLSGANLVEADLSKANLTEADLWGLKNWATIRSMEGTILTGVKDPPPGFLDWAKKKGAVF